MPKRAPKLLFTKEERAMPEMKKVIKKADKAAEKLEKAESKIPKKTIKTKKRVVDPKTGKVTTRLFFEEVEKKRPPSKLSHAITNAPTDILNSSIHQKIRENNDDNSGVEAVNNVSEGAQGTYRVSQSIHHSQEEKPYLKAEKAQANADKANLKALNKEYEINSGKTTNPYSKWQQKRAIKKEYAAAKAGNGAKNTVKASETAAKAAKRTAKESKKVGSFIMRHKGAFLIIGGIIALLLIVSSGFSSCSMMFQGSFSSISATTYPAKDEDIFACEENYLDMEGELQEKISNYESEHDYDEYRYVLDDITHDPHSLISAVSAIMGKNWTVGEVGGIIQQIFDNQYTLTENVITQTRYRTETRTDYYIYTDPNTGVQEVIEYQYIVQVPYSYYICTVTLTDNGLKNAAQALMNEEQKTMYDVYITTSGNRPDLFG